MADTGKVIAGGLRGCHKNLGSFKTQDSSAGGGAFVLICGHVVSINKCLFILEEFPSCSWGIPPHCGSCLPGQKPGAGQRWHASDTPQTSWGCTLGVAPLLGRVATEAPSAGGSVWAQAAQSSQHIHRAAPGVSCTVFTYITPQAWLPSQLLAPSHILRGSEHAPG